MDIRVQVNDVTLDSVISEANDYHDGITIGAVVAQQLAQRVINDHDAWPPFRDAVTQIRDEEIRAQVQPLITDALTKTLQKTNTYGEPTGQATTLSEIIVAEAKRLVTQPKDSYSRSGRTVLQEMVAAEVKAALSTEIADAVKKARELVAGQIGEMVSAAVAEGMRKR
jgi:hypothetical protein